MYVALYLICCVCVFLPCLNFVRLGGLLVMQHACRLIGYCVTQQLQYEHSCLGLIFDTRLYLELAYLVEPIFSVITVMG